MNDEARRRWRAASLILVIALMTRVGLLFAIGVPGRSVAHNELGRAALALAAVGLDVLWTDSGKAARLVELVGFCFIPHIASCAALLLVALWLPSPAALAHTMNPAGAALSMEQYRQIVTSLTPFVMVHSFSYVAWMWTACLVGVCLRVVSGIEPRRVVMSFAALAAVCAALYAVRL